MRLKIFYLFVLSCIFAYANPANGIHDIILKGENHDNTVFGITLGKSTFEEATKNSIFKDCNFQQIPYEGYENAPWKKYESKNCVAHFENIKGVYFNKFELTFDENNKIMLIILFSSPSFVPNTTPEDSFKLFADLLGRKYKFFGSGQNGGRFYTRGDDMSIGISATEYVFLLKYELISFMKKRAKFSDEQRNQQSNEL